MYLCTYLIHMCLDIKGFYSPDVGEASVVRLVLYTLSHSANVNIH